MAAWGTMSEKPGDAAIATAGAIKKAIVSGIRFANPCDPGFLSEKPGDVVVATAGA